MDPMYLQYVYKYETAYNKECTRVYICYACVMLCIISVYTLLEKRTTSFTTVIAVRIALPAPAPAPALAPAKRYFGLF